MTVGVLASGYPQGDGIPTTSLLGQLVGTAICTILLGFIPGYGVSFVLRKLNMLRVPEAEEITGLDLSDFGIEGYPEYSVLPEETVHRSAPVTSVAQLKN